jgi:flagellar export protein FliJ
MLETHRKRWIAKRQRLESLERVLEKYRIEERVQEARQEQKQLDELPNSQAAFLDDE